ncbi:hypothetical protein O0L34_g11342 [Tuta absoluta]|nr:hypothetical protein O0L34_g11342 [Tuta absoluta]
MRSDVFVVAPYSIRLVDALSTHLAALSDERDLHALVMLTSVARHVQYNEIGFALDYYYKIADDPKRRDPRLMALTLELLEAWSRWARTDARTRLRNHLVRRLATATDDGCRLASANLAAHLDPLDLTWATELLQLSERAALNSTDVEEWVRAADLSLVAPAPPSPRLKDLFLNAIAHPPPEWSAECLGMCVVGLGRLCVRSRDTATLAAPPLAMLLQDHTAPLAARVNALLTLTDICIRYAPSGRCLGMCVVGLGRLCVRSRDTATLAAPPLAMLLQDHTAPLAARVNALLTLTDICIRYAPSGRCLGMCVVGLGRLCVRSRDTATLAAPPLAMLLQDHTAPLAARVNALLTLTDICIRYALSRRCLGMCVVGLGRLCVRSRDTATLAAPPLAMLLQDHTAPLAARVNALLTLTDICIRYTCIVEPLLGCMSGCLCPAAEGALRRAAARSLTRLLLAGYLRLRTPLYYRYCALLADDDHDVREPAEYYVTCCLTADTIYHHFVDCVMHYNDDGNTESKISFDNRQLIYDVMLQRLSIVQKLNLQCRLAREVLEHAADMTDEGDGELTDAMNAALLDTITLLCGPRMKLPRKPQRDGEAGDVDDLQERITTNIVSHKMKSTVAEVVVPAVLRLHSRLRGKGGQVVAYLVRIATDLLLDYRHEIEELIENDEELVQSVRQFQETIGTEPSFGNTRNLVTSSTTNEPETPRASRKRPQRNTNRVTRTSYVTPQAPRKPDPHVTPQAPRKPDPHVTPQAPRKPDPHVTPQAPRKPDPHVTPQAPRKPDPHVTPQAPRKPDPHVTPQAPRKPDPHVTPQAPRKPDPHVTPQAPRKPDPPTKPAIKVRDFSSKSGKKKKPVEPKPKKRVHFLLDEIPPKAPQVSPAASARLSPVRSSPPRLSPVPVPVSVPGPSSKPDCDKTRERKSKQSPRKAKASPATKPKMRWSPVPGPSSQPDSQIAWVPSSRPDPAGPRSQIQDSSDDDDMNGSSSRADAGAPAVAAAGGGGELSQHLATLQSSGGYVAVVSLAPSRRVSPTPGPSDRADDDDFDLLFGT